MWPLRGKRVVVVNIQFFLTATRLSWILSSRFLPAASARLPIPNICSANMRHPAGPAHRFFQYAGGIAMSTVVLAERYAGLYNRPNPTKLLGLIAALLPELAFARVLKNQPSRRSEHAWASPIGWQMHLNPFAPHPWHPPDVPATDRRASCSLLAGHAPTRRGGGRRYRARMATSGTSRRSSGRGPRLVRRPRVLGRAGAISTPKNPIR